MTPEQAQRLLEEEERRYLPMALLTAVALTQLSCSRIIPNRPVYGGPPPPTPTVNVSPHT